MMVSEPMHDYSTHTNTVKVRSGIGKTSSGLLVVAGELKLNSKVKPWEDGG
jgi:hypothetical protein